MRDVVEI